MAKIKFGNIVADARNAAGGIVFSRNTYGAYVRQKVSPVQPRSPAQQAQRSAMSSLSKRYRDVLTPTQRLGWASFAGANPRSDVFGAPITLSPIAMYQSVNRIVQLCGGTLLDDPPADLAVETPVTFSLVADESDQKITASYTVDPSVANMHVALFLTQQFSAGALFFTNKLRQLAVTVANHASPLELTTEYTGRFGNLQTGAQIGGELKYYNSNNGAVSTGIRAATIVVA